MSVAYIAIGSNLGNRQENCSHAIDLMEKRGIIVTKRSSLYETEPWGVRNQPPFINMAVEAETELEPWELLKVLKNIEREMGREGSLRWGPRTIDLDILLFDDMIIAGDNLEIPHPSMHERDFMLRPLCEIAPDVSHPLLKVSISGLLQQLNKKL